jgi:ABC-type transport system involved in multi-copper enzyme maturation permease subunit
MKGPDALTLSQRLSGVRLIAARELGAYFDSGIAYVYTIAFVVLTNSIFMNEFFLTGTVDMTGFFDLLPLLLAIFLSAVSMRLWAEERRQRTIELLLTLPIRPSQAILGKYLAALGLLGLFIIGSLPIVVMLCVLGSPDGGLILGGYLGLFFLGALLLASGMFLSALSGDQIVAFVANTLLGFFLILSGNDKVVAVLDGMAPSLSLGTILHENVSVAPRYEAFVRGVVELPALVYFAGMSALFLWATRLVLSRIRT